MNLLGGQKTLFSQLFSFVIKFKYMCRLLAMSGKINPQKSTLILEKFQRLAEYGKTQRGATKGHKDGWGIAYYNNKKLAGSIKDTSSALDNKKYSRFVQLLAKKNPNLIMAHLRKASVGKKSIPNTQPFMLENFAFVHNGTLRNSKNISLSNKYIKKINGDTDSEKLFFYFLDSLKTKSYLCKKIIQRSMKFVKNNFNYSALNFILSDGVNIYASREAKILASYYSLYFGQGSDFFLICSEKLPVEGIKWIAIKNHQLLTLTNKN